MSRPSSIQTTPGISPDSGIGSGEGESKTREKSRRRNRIIHSCLECRRRKMKCDRLEPCNNCSKAERQCVYINSANSDDLQLRQRLVQMKEAKDAIANSFQNNIESQSLRQERKASHRKRSRLPNEVQSEESDNSTDNDFLEPTPLAINDAAYEDNSDGTVEDIGFSIGRMHLSERIGGLYRPRIADEILSSLENIPKRGPSVTVSTTSSKNPKETTIIKEFEAPVDLIFNHSHPEGLKVENLVSRSTADKLLERYWESVHPVARVIHRPSFAQRYETLWEALEEGHQDKIVPSLSAIVLSILLSSVMSMSDTQVWTLCQVSRKELENKLKLGTEAALGRAQLLSSSKIETLQAFVAYLLSMCAGKICRAHALMTSMAIRLAECMGLHRDPSEYGFPPTETQVRRLIWYQICYLDLKTSEIQGPRPYIHHDGYTTQVPGPITTSSWNDMIFSMIRFECQEMQRKCLILRNRVDQKKTSLTKALSKIEAFRVSMDAKYGHFLDTSTPSPMQRMARLVMKLFTSLLYLIFLHRYMNSVTYRVPDRLRQIVLSKGTAALEAAMELEVADDLKEWAWYSSAYQQYHTAFLLLVEVFTFPMRREANRIWKCLDFIFADVLRDTISPEFNITTKVATLQDLIAHRDAKARYLLTMICNKMRTYQKAKGLKNPIHFKDSMIILTPQKDGDTSDPRMPLNYAHGEPEPEPEDVSRRNPAIFQHSSSYGHFPETGGVSASYFDNIGVGTVAPFQSENTASEWISSHEDFVYLPQNYESQAQFSDETTSYPHEEQPSYLAPGWTPNGSSQQSDYSEIQRGTGDIDPKILEIDWNLWDTIFPPGSNDGALDISSDYMWESYSN